MRPLKTLALACALAVPLPAAAETLLYMAEEHGCFWCERWNTEISAIYPKTIEGKTAPLRRFDLHGKKPDVTFVRSVNFTPTFILVEDGQEVGRIEGYPGEDFFWPLLTGLFTDANIPLDENS